MVGQCGGAFWEVQNVQAGVRIRVKRFVGFIAKGVPGVLHGGPGWNAEVKLEVHGGGYLVGQGVFEGVGGTAFDDYIGTGGGRGVDIGGAK